MLSITGQHSLHMQIMTSRTHVLDLQSVLHKHIGEFGHGKICESFASCRMFT